MSGIEQTGEYEVLKGSGNDGDFVLKNQEIATKQGFSHVSKIWYDKTLSYDEAIGKLDAQVAEREDLLIPIKEFVPTIVVDGDKAEIVFEDGDGRQFTPTLHALRQFATFADIPHTYINQAAQESVLKPNKQVKYQRDAQDVETFWRVLKNGHRHIPSDKVFRFRTYKDGTLRAVLTEKYTPVDNRWYIEQLKKLVPGGRVSHFDFANADTLYGNILIPDTIREEFDSEYGGMLSVGNCEIGIRVFEQYPSVFRAICMNGCIWDRTKGAAIRQVHRGIDLDELAAAMKENLERQIPLLPQGIERLLGIRAKGTDGANLKQIIGGIAIQNQFTAKQAEAVAVNWLNFEKGERNLFGITNAITRAAQEFPANDWLRMDTVAGNLVNYDDDEWGNFKKYASTLDDNKLEKVFA